jgi:3-phenylpropionate/trans-cinnamate dioxygenase ferredoxin subunit
LTRNKIAMSDWVDVAEAEEFKPGSWRVIDLDDVLVAVFNLDGDYYAIEDICTHDNGTLTGGELEDGQIVCPRHGARFDIRTGEALTPPAYEPVPTLPVRVENGLVQVRDDRWD